MWDGVRHTRGRAFCGHFLTSYLSRSKYALIDRLRYYNCASQVSNWHRDFPTMQQKSLVKDIIEVEVGSGCV